MHMRTALNILDARQESRPQTLVFAVLEQDADERTQGQKCGSGFAVTEFVTSVSHFPQLVLYSWHVLVSVQRRSHDGRYQA